MSDVANSHRPLRVGIVTDGLKEGRNADGSPRIANGGVGVYIYNLVKHLQQLAGGPELVLMRCGRGDLDIYDGARTSTAFLRCTPWNRLGRWLDWPYRRVVREHRLDVVHHPNQFGGVFLPRTVRQVVTMHDISPLLLPHTHQWKTRLRYRHLMHRSLAQADRVITDSMNTRQDLLDRGLAADSKISVIPLGVAPEYTPSASVPDLDARYDLPKRFILTVGVLEPRKNHGLLVEALRRLHAAGDKVGLVIVGRPGWNWTDPRTMPEASELANWIRVYSDVPDVDLAEFYRRAEVFAYPSLYEGFGLPVIEAMACGTPVVVSRVASLPGVANGAALFHDPTNAEDLVARLREVFQDAALRKRLAADGPLHAQEFSWRRTARSTVEVYGRVCGAVAPETEYSVAAPAIVRADESSALLR